MRKMWSSLTWWADRTRVSSSSSSIRDRIRKRRMCVIERMGRARAAAVNRAAGVVARGGRRVSTHGWWAKRGDGAVGMRSGQGAEGGELAVGHAVGAWWWVVRPAVRRCVEREPVFLGQVDAAVVPGVAGEAANGLERCERGL